jgi:microcystin-dependent protein
MHDSMGIVDGRRSLPPRGWALCDASPLPIIPNAPLYAILGTT